MRSIALEHLVANLTLWILHQKSSLGSFYEDDEHDHCNRQNRKAQDNVG